MHIHQYCVYIVTNASDNILYTGVTSDIKNRILEHKEKINNGFTAKYQCNKLVYFETFQWIDDAISREKQIKGGSRQAKLNLIIAINPKWLDLSEGWYN